MGIQGDCVTTSCSFSLVSEQLSSASSLKHSTSLFRAAPESTDTLGPPEFWRARRQRRSLYDPPPPEGVQGVFRIFKLRSVWILSGVEGPHLCRFFIGGSRPFYPVGPYFSSLFFISFLEYVLSHFGSKNLPQRLPT